MRRSEIALSLALAGSLASGAWLWSEMRAERARSAELQALLDQATQPPTSSLSSDVEVPDAATTVPAPPASIVTAPAPETTAQQNTAVSQEDWNAQERRLMQDPRYRETRRDQERLKLSLRRDNLVRLLGLTPEQADAVIDLQIDNEWLQSEQWRNPEAMGSREERRRRAEALEAAYQANLQEMLGYDKREKLQHYMESRPSRMQVDDFRTQLTGPDLLRDDQIEPLIEALHVERTRARTQLNEFRDTLDWETDSQESSKRYAEKQAELMKDMHAGMHASSAAILSSSQLRQLDAMLEIDRKRHETRMRMSRIQSKIDSAGGAPPPN